MQARRPRIDGMLHVLKWSQNCAAPCAMAAGNRAALPVADIYKQIGTVTSVYKHSIYSGLPTQLRNTQVISVQVKVQTKTQTTSRP